VLGLNEVGVCALRDAKYPVPEIGGLPFCVWPIRMRHGLGVANAYVVGECDGANALLFDTGPAGDSATRQWPAKVRALQAIFLTHWEPEHAGGLGAALARFGKVPVFGPGRPETAEAIPLGDGEVREFGGFVVQALGTPGHVAAHNCYLVKSARAPSGNPLLISGDMLFAGSAGGAYHCRVQWRAQLDRIFSEIPGQAVVAPGHGPMTTLTHERLFNPFSR
jgi:glyoxylase-like metal-dependent hydrolase (beta-lactamase superfamily II)